MLFKNFGLEFWNRRLDEVREKCTAKTDVELSFHIKISPAMISQIRTGKRDIPFDLKIKILDELEYVFDHDLLIRLLPPDKQNVLCSSMLRRNSSSISEIQSENAGKEVPPLAYDLNP